MAFQDAQRCVLQQEIRNIYSLFQLFKTASAQGLKIVKSCHRDNTVCLCCLRPIHSSDDDDENCSCNQRRQSACAGRTAPRVKKVIIMFLWGPQGATCQILR